jgi:hypothetical protein
MPGPDPNKPVQNYQPAQRHVGTGPDSDGDGLSDDFETNVFFSDPTAKDPDGDGLNDYAEYWLDTNPKNEDSDGDGFLDGEDLAFGDPLRWNDGGADRIATRNSARQLFDLEGSDKDKDWVRDTLERAEGTKIDNPDSDGDGLSDGVEIQLRNRGVTTNQDSTPDDTTDLDAARERLGERRWESDKPPWSSSADESADDTTELAASDPLSADALAGEPYDAASLAADVAPVETAYEETSYTGDSYAAEDLAADVGASTDGFADGSTDSWA